MNGINSNEKIGFGVNIKRPLTNAGLLSVGYLGGWLDRYLILVILHEVVALDTQTHKLMLGS